MKPPRIYKSLEGTAGTGTMIEGCMPFHIGKGDLTVTWAFIEQTLVSRRNDWLFWGLF